MEIVTGDCPLGAKCETSGEKNGKPVIIRCPWYVAVRGRDGNKGEEVDEFRCAIAWMPLLQANNIGTVRQATSAVESLRNEVVNENNKTRQLLGESANKMIGDNHRT